MTTTKRLPRTFSQDFLELLFKNGASLHAEGDLPPKLYNSEHGISSTITYVDHCESYEGAWVVRAQKKPKCTCSETQCYVCHRGVGWCGVCGGVIVIVVVVVAVAVVVADHRVSRRSGRGHLVVRMSSLPPIPA